MFRTKFREIATSLTPRNDVKKDTAKHLCS